MWLRLRIRVTWGSRDVFVLHQAGKPWALLNKLAPISGLFQLCHCEGVDDTGCAITADRTGYTPSSKTQHCDTAQCSTAQGTLCNASKLINTEWAETRRNLRKHPTQQYSITTWLQDFSATVMHSDKANRKWHTHHCEKTQTSDVW